MKLIIWRLRCCLFGDRRPIKRKFSHSELGEFRYKESSESWEGERGGLRLVLEGDWSYGIEKILPSEGAISAAVEFVSEGADLEPKLAAFLSAQAVARPKFPEIASLEIASVIFEDDGDAEVQFVDDSRFSWHCIYRNGEFTDLAFDR